MTRQELRTGIAKTLVKWSMPTRQAAISDIMKLIDQYAAESQMMCDNVRRAKQRIQSGLTEHQDPREAGTV